MRFPGKNARLVVGGAAVLLLAGILTVAYVLVGRMLWANDTLAVIEPRYARLAGLREVRTEIETGLTQVQATLGRYAYPASMNGDRIGTDLQQRVRRVAEAAGMSVSGSQILPVRPADGFTHVPVSVSAEGTLESLRNMLAGLAAESPTIQVESIVIQSVARRRARGAPEDQRLAVQMNLAAIHLQP